MKNIILILAFLISSVGVFAQEDSVIAVIPPVEYQQQIKKEKVQLIDVRTPEEFAAGHIEGAKNIDFKADDFQKKFADFSKDEPLYLYCRSGNRSGKAAKELAKLGFQNIVDLEGGYLSWQELSNKE